MRKSTLAALDHAAQKKLVETAQKLARTLGVELSDDLAGSQGPPEVQAMKQRAAMADLLVGILNSVKSLKRALRTRDKKIKELHAQVKVTKAKE